MSLSSFEFIPLTEELELLPFRCKDEDLNNFLFDDAKHYLAELMAGVTEGLSLVTPHITRKIGND